MVHIIVFKCHKRIITSTLLFNVIWFSRSHVVEFVGDLLVCEKGGLVEYNRFCIYKIYSFDIFSHVTLLSVSIQWVFRKYYVLGQKSYENDSQITLPQISAKWIIPDMSMTLKITVNATRCNWINEWIKKIMMYHYTKFELICLVLRWILVKKINLIPYYILATIYSNNH